jgi:hypothetical protein
MKQIKPSADELKIIIPTYKRETVKQQIAYSMIPDEFKDRAYFLIREERHELMLKAFPNANYILIPEDSVVCLSDSRQWVLENAGFDKQWHLDDDVKLFGKRDENYRIRGNINLEQFTELYNLISEKLDGYAYVGLSARLFNNLKTAKFDENYACYTCFAFRADILNAEKAKFDELLVRDSRITIAEDKWMCTYLLYLGYKNVILNEWVYDQKDGHVGSGAEELGGCYGHKTKESNDLATQEFMRSFPGCVYKKTQKVKNSEGAVVDEYQYPIIRWKKVFGMGEV